jgi:cell division transport system permease protein
MKQARRNRTKPSVRSRFGAWGDNHARALLFSLGKLYRSPVATLLTVTVIAIALALPTGLLLLLANLERLGGGLESSTTISAFTTQQVQDSAAARLAREITDWPEVGAVEFRSREQALAEFRERSGLGAALDALDENPLPAVLLVTPTAATAEPEALAGLVERLQALPEVEFAQLDTLWVQRLFAIMNVGRRGVEVIALLLGLAVLLVVGNTIRLDIQNRREEIVVTKLIGATDAFIRRPFLYGGLWYGLLGGGLAVLIVSVSLLALQGPVSHLAGLYDSSFRLSGPGPLDVLGLLVAGTLLGLGGSWIAVGRHLREIEPS